MTDCIVLHLFNYTNGRCHNQWPTLRFMALFPNIGNKYFAFQFWPGGAHTNDLGSGRSQLDNF